MRSFPRLKRGRHGSGVPSGNPVKAGLTASIVVTCTLSGSVSVRIFVAQTEA